MCRTFALSSTNGRRLRAKKLLFSATLTRDPSKIAALNLREPKYFIVQSKARSDSVQNSAIVDVVMEKFTMPATLKVMCWPARLLIRLTKFGLQENMIICEPAQKPLFLFHLIHVHDIKNAIIFTKSAESATRLVQLFQFFESSRTSEKDPSVVLRAYSSDLSPSDRKAVLDKFKNQEINMCVILFVYSTTSVADGTHQTGLLGSYISRDRHYACVACHQL